MDRASRLTSALDIRLQTPQVAAAEDLARYLLQGGPERFAHTAAVVLERNS
jgi:hypothetical protein